MKIRFNRSGQTVVNGEHVTQNDVVDVPDEMGAALVASGSWDQIKDEAKPEKKKAAKK